MPFAGEDLGALDEWFGQADGSGVVVAGGLDGDDGEAAVGGLEAEVGSVEVEAQVGVESQGRVPGYDQEQFVECGDSCG